MWKANSTISQGSQGAVAVVLRSTTLGDTSMGTAEVDAFFVRQGYAFMAQDCRGHFDSKARGAP